jgi:GDP-mannose 6-dehydrogenase
MFTPRRITVFGLGYVGSVSAACLAKLGHSVCGIDISEMKVQSILQGKAPFYEPGLEPLIAETVAAGRLWATTDVRAALENAEVALICVGTPSERNGNLNLEYVRRVCEQIRACLDGRSAKLVVAVRSTVFPGTCEEVVLPALGHHPQAVVVSNPEFLREGAAVKDFLEPSLLVVGGYDRAAMELVAGLYEPLPVEACLVSLRTAEMIKYACNAFHATKVAFANEIGALASEMGIDPVEVMDTLCRDEKLNTSRAYLRPGFAFGGSCLPKDVRALCYRGARLDLKLPLMESLLPSNQQHIDRAVRAIYELPARRIGIYGLAFKENTDDLRESPVVTLIETLHGKGRELRVFDPHIQLGSIYGSNRNYVLSSIPHIERLMAPSLEALLTGCDHLVIAQKPSAEAQARIAASSLPRLDLVHAFSPQSPLTT